MGPNSLSRTIGGLTGMMTGWGLAYERLATTNNDECRGSGITSNHRCMQPTFNCAANVTVPSCTDIFSDVHWQILINQLKTTGSIGWLMVNDGW